jgi:hypothetical protein
MRRNMSFFRDLRIAFHSLMRSKGLAIIVMAGHSKAEIVSAIKAASKTALWWLGRYPTFRLIPASCNFAASAFPVPSLTPCDLNHRLAISEASVGRSSACKSCKSGLRQSAPSDVWSIGWPSVQNREHPLTAGNLALIFEY